jgi:geranylgeranyl pyrophosphate synthase
MRSMNSKAITPQTVAHDVDRFIGAYLDERIQAADEIHASYGQLWRVIAQVFGAGGKRFRPYALVLTYDALGGTERDKILPIAAMLELLHVSLLVIDDIIDRDHQRHGQPNVSGTYLRLYADALPNEVDRLHYATSAALMAGNLLINGAYDAILAADLPEAQRRTVQHLLSEALFTAAGGEFIDVESTFMHHQAWLTIARTKTSSYSFVLPLRLGAILAGAPAKVQTHLVAMGNAMGIAFQLSDDLLDIFADEIATGKSRFRDVREGLPTYVLTQALELANPTDRRWLEGMFHSATVTGPQGQRIQSIVEQSGARAQTEKQIATYVSDAKTNLARLKLPPQADQAFGQLIDKIAWRKA